MGDPAAGVMAIGRALAAEIGWRFVDERDSHAPATLARTPGGRLIAGSERFLWLPVFRETIAGAVNRREHIVAVSPTLTDADRQALRGGLRPIRFVSLQALTRSSPATALNDVVIVDATCPTERIIGVIRDEFGL